MTEPADKLPIHDPIKLNEYDWATPAAARDQPRANFSALGKSITGWTSNLLATALVVMIAMTFGSQLVSSWLPRNSRAESTFEIQRSWPTLQACSLEFGDSPFQLTRETFTGSEAEVRSFLQGQCREELESNAQPVREIGQSESKMISLSMEQEPVEQVAGKWRIFVGPKLDEFQPLPLALGIRDNCQTSLATPTDSGKIESRLVVWALAMPAEDGRWTTFVAQSSTLNSTLGLDQLLPMDAKRTLAMTDPAGASIIGFSDGDFYSAITFYTNMASKRNWQLEIDRADTRNSWSAQLVPEASGMEESAIKGLQVQLTLDHNEKLTGILVVQSNQRHSKTAGTHQPPK